MIRVSQINKSFVGRQVLYDISAVFEAGRTHLIIGQSGSGKTVLMKCLVGLLEVDSGNIEYDGRNFAGMNPTQRKTIRKEMGMLFQGGALFDSMNVQENVKFPLRMYSELSASEMQKRVDFCLERVNLSNAHHLMPSEISGGMIKRVAIARAIALNPKYLFCDEPNSGLDPQTAQLIDGLIAEITHEYNMITIINTHDMNSVLEIGEDINFIFNGRLWWHGDRQTVLNSGNQELDTFVFSTGLTKRIRP